MSGGRGDGKLREAHPSPPGVSVSLFHTSVQRLVAAGIDPDEARLEAEVLLRHVLGIDRAAFLMRRDDPLVGDAAERFAVLLERRLKREPLAYITGQREFYGLAMLVDRRVLIPRPETEGLVERTIALAHGAALIVDVGTGSGCIAIALAVHLPQARVIATDAAADALACARENAARHGVAERITLLHGDLLQPLQEQVDIIVSNPPYIPSQEIGDLAPEIAQYEPCAALDGGPDGLDVLRRLLAQTAGRLRPGGYVLLEIGAGQGNDVARIARTALPGATIAVENDLAGLERYVTIRTPGNT